MVAPLMFLVKLCIFLGILSPNLRCVLHVADSSIKRKTNSKTMNIQELSDFLPSFQSVLRHVQLSEKRTVMLNDVIEMLDIMWFCPTRILFSYILFAGWASCTHLCCYFNSQHQTRYNECIHVSIISQTVNILQVLPENSLQRQQFDYVCI